MEPLVATLVSRQQHHRYNCTRTEDGFFDESTCYVPFWYTKTGVILKWSLFLGLVAFIFLYLLVGYMHAKRRIRKGLPPLGYHRFLVSRTQRPPHMNPRYQAPGAEASPYYTNGQVFGMHGMPPPPVYDPSRPPQYPGPTQYPGPPDGATKVDPTQQNQNAPAPTTTPPPPDYAAPPGPPPSALPAQNTGSNPFRL